MLTGVTNFRDFGGYPVGDGRSVRTGVLFRGGQLAGATQADIEKLTALGLSVIVDLRRGPERERQPTGRWADRCRTIRSDSGGDDPWWTFLRDSDLSAGSIRGHLLDFYRGLPFDPSYIDLFSRFFEALATTTGPLLVHCTGAERIAPAWLSRLPTGCWGSIPMTPWPITCSPTGFGNLTATEPRSPPGLPQSSDAPPEKPRCAQ
jgi:protein tyrosine/serine phosphatase